MIFLFSCEFRHEEKYSLSANYNFFSHVLLVWCEYNANNLNHEETYRSISNILLTSIQNVPRNSMQSSYNQIVSPSYYKQLLSLTWPIAQRWDSCFGSCMAIQFQLPDSYTIQHYTTSSQRPATSYQLPQDCNSSDTTETTLESRRKMSGKMELHSRPPLWTAPKGGGAHVVTHAQFEVAPAVVELAPAVIVLPSAVITHSRRPLGGAPWTALGEEVGIAAVGRSVVDHSYGEEVAIAVRIWILVFSLSREREELRQAERRGIIPAES